MSEIVVSDLGDVRAVVCAFQRAIDSVLNESTVSLFWEGYFGEMFYQYVYHGDSTSPVGFASFLLGKPNVPEGALSIWVYAPGHDKGRGAATYVSDGIVSRLAVSIPAIVRVQRLEYNADRKRYVAHVAAPIDVLQRRPRGLITLRAS